VVRKLYRRRRRLAMLVRANTVVRIEGARIVVFRCEGGEQKTRIGDGVAAHHRGGQYFYFAYIDNDGPDSQPLRPR
jgi:hypothetical protein